MSVLNIPKNYADRFTPTEQQLDSIKESIETFFNATKVGADNIENSSISVSLINNISATTQKFVTGSIITSKISDQAVNVSKLDSIPLGTAKFGTGAGTLVKTVSTAVHSTPTGGSGGLVILASKSITTTGGGVVITAVGRIAYGAGSTALFSIYKNGSLAAQAVHNLLDNTTQPAKRSLTFCYYDTPTPSTHTYDLRCTLTGAFSSFDYAQISLREL